MRAHQLSTTVYRWLLRAYPAAFRRAYGAQMVAAFQRQRHETRYASPLGALTFWFDILTDLSASAFRRRFQPRFTSPRFPRKRESLMGTLLQDLKYAARGLRRNRGVTIAALLTLAIGIGANTAMFSLVNGVLLRPFPYPDPDELVFIWDSNPQRGWNAFSVSPPNFIDYREQNTTFASMTSYFGGNVTLSGTEEPERLRVTRVGPNYFQTFGIEPQFGRAFAPSDNLPGQNNVAVLSASLWRRRFRADPNVIGTTVTLDGVPVTIVGVFTAPNDAPADTELWVPADFSPDSLGSRGAHYFTVVGRLKPEASPQRAGEDIRQIATRLEQEYPDTNAGWTAVVEPLHEGRVGSTRTSLLVLSGAVALVLLIACANVANLLLARATHRRREVAVRVALGAGRARIFSQVLSESVLLGLAGGAAGLAIAQSITWALVSWTPDSLPRLAQVEIDLRVLAYTALLSLGTAVAFGMAPAVQAANADVNGALKQVGGGDRSRGGVRNSLVVTEVALAVVVVVGAGLLLRSLWNLQAMEPGFAVESRVAARVGLPRSYDPAEQAQFFDQLTRNLAASPAIAAVGATDLSPMRGDFSISFTIEGRPEPADGQDPSGEMRSVDEGFFQALEIPFVAGRNFAASDRLATPPVVIVNQRFADLYFPGEEAIGQRLRIGYAHARDAERVREVIGVVADTRVHGLSREPVPVYYVSSQQTPEPSMDVILRTGPDTAAAIAVLRREVGALDNSVPVSSVRTLQEQVRASAAPQRFRAMLLGSFAAIALLLASIGIYGVMAYSVAQRTREMGIRIALGAAHGDVMSMVLKRGLTLAAAGVAIGSLAAVGIGRLLSGLLFGVASTDPLTFACVVVFLMTVAMGACYFPARRATRVDPTVAMRAE